MHVILNNLQVTNDSKKESIVFSILENSKGFINNKKVNNSVKKRILIVDDSKINVKVATKHLIELGFETDECYEGQQCLDKIQFGNEYDLILMDIMMPSMSGEKILTKLKEKLQFKIPVIAVTADAIAGSREKYLSEGFSEYLSKPFSKEQLKKKIDQVLKL